MASRPGWQTIPIHILTNISKKRESGNAISSSNWRIWWRNYSKTFFWKSKKLSKSSWSIVSRFIQFFLFFSGLEQLKLSFRPLTFISFISFSAWFFKKNISITMFFYQNKFYCLFAFTSWDIGQYMYCNCLLTRLRRHKFWY